jgi:uncharacterized protein (TIGR01244 family)
MTRFSSLSAGLLSLSLALGACASGISCSGDESQDSAQDQAEGTGSNDTTTLSAADMPAELELRNFVVISSRVAGGGAPSIEQIADMKGMGYSTIINLRNTGEPGLEEEAAAAAAAGLQYVHIPVDGATASLTNAKDVLAALEKAPEGKVLLHCASGNRVGAIWGMAQAIENGLSIEEATAVARKAGMRSDGLAARIDSELSAVK